MKGKVSYLCIHIATIVTGVLLKFSVLSCPHTSPICYRDSPSGGK